MAFRVPTPNVSVVDLTCRLEKPVSVTNKTQQPPDLPLLPLNSFHLELPFLYLSLP